MTDTLAPPVAPSYPYPKIDTLYTRDDDFKLTQEYRNDAFGMIKSWVVTEKIDGMNMRVTITPDLDVFVAGRTDRAQIPGRLGQHMQDVLGGERRAALLDAFEIPELREDRRSITLYGEGFGAGIQKGGGYGEEQRFALFDVRIGDSWLNDQAVSDIAAKLGILRAPILDVLDVVDPLETIRELVAGGFMTTVEGANATEKQAEGIIARPPQTLYDQRHHRIIFKLKTSDFAK